MEDVRTSSSHPLRIDSVNYPFTRGEIGMTLCPGKQQARGRSGARWQRDLAADLDAIRGWGADHLLTFVEAHELLHLKVPTIGAEATARGLRWHHLPIEDGGVPSELVFKRWRQVSFELHHCLSQGGKVVLHCMGGLGRSGTMGALVLIEAGTKPEQAVERIRAARPGAIETSEQEDWLMSFPQPEEPGPRGMLWRR